MNSFTMLGWEGIFLIVTGSIAFIGLMGNTYRTTSERRSLTKQIKVWFSKFYSSRLQRLHMLLNSHQVIKDSQDSKSLSI